MGCDIHSHAEVRRDGRWQKATGAIVTPLDKWADASEPFGWRSYGMFGLLADVRNYSHSPVIAEPRGLPDDVSLEVRDDHDGDVHSASWLTLADLLAYDYDQAFWDRRVTRGNNGAALAEEGEGRHLTLRELLGSLFFQHLDELGKLGDPADVRVVFWFDN